MFINYTIITVVLTTQVLHFVVLLHIQVKKESVCLSISKQFVKEKGLKYIYQQYTVH